MSALLIFTEISYPFPNPQAAQVNWSLFLYLSKLSSFFLLLREALHLHGFLTLLCWLVLFKTSRFRCDNLISSSLLNEERGKKKNQFNVHFSSYGNEPIYPPIYDLILPIYKWKLRDGRLISRKVVEALRKRNLLLWSAQPDFFPMESRLALQEVF